MTWAAFAAFIPWRQRERAPKLTRGDLSERVIELERRLAAVQDQAALRMAGVERRASLLAHENHTRIQALEHQVRELNPGLPPIDRAGRLDA